MTEQDSQVVSIERANLTSLLDELDLLEQVIGRYRLMLDAQGDLVYRSDLNGRLTFVNDSFVKMAALPRQQLLGEVYSLPEVAPPQGLGQQSGELSEDDQWIETPQGLRCYNWQSFPLSLGQTKEKLFIGRDITDRLLYLDGVRRAKEEAEQATQMKSRFLSTVAHEVRTPINGVLGLIDLLQEGDLSPSQRTYAGLIRTSADSLLHLVNDLLDFEKINSNKMPLTIEEVSLERLVSELVELLAPRAEEKGIELSVMVDPLLPALLPLDGKRVRQILLNLVGNAIKFTDSGGVALYVRRFQRSHSGSLEFTIVDSGCGISPDDQQRVFQEFEQVVTNNKAKEGTGLGLAISLRLARLMEGEIRLDSSSSGGSVFTFALPLPEEALSDFSLATQLSGYKVIINSLQPVLYDALAEQIQKLGGEVILDEGDVSYYKDCLYLVDCSSDEDSALHTIKTIRQAGGVTLALLSVQSRNHLLPTLEAIGAGAYLVKPLRPASLVKMIRQAMGRVESVPTFEAPAEELRSGNHNRNDLRPFDDDLNGTENVDIFAQNGEAQSALSAEKKKLTSYEEFQGSGSASDQPSQPEREAGISLFVSESDEKPSSSPQGDRGESFMKQTADIVPLVRSMIKKSQPRVRVLVAEDNDINALLIESMLDRLGADAIRVTDGLNAVETFVDHVVKEQPFDLLIFDMRMPDMDGAEAIAEIRSMERELGGDFYTPAVCLSASTFEDQRDYCENSGFDKLLQKPIDIETLKSLMVYRSEGLHKIGKADA